MSEVKSPLGKKSFASGPRKILTVTDDSFDDVPMIPQQPGRQMQEPMSQQPVRLNVDQFNEMQAKRNELRSTQKKSTSESKLRAEILCGIGRLQTEVIAGGSKFVLQSLKSGEMKEVMKLVSQVSIAAEAMFEMRANILARALYTVDDQPIELVLGANSLEDIIDFVNDLQESFVNQLYTSYTSMVKTNDEKFTVKNEADAQEVAEEIKKL